MLSASWQIVIGLVVEWTRVICVCGLGGKWDKQGSVQMVP